MDKSDFQIDKFKLDMEWLRQTDLYFEYAEKAAKARRDMDQAKVNWDLEALDIQNAVRANPTKHGIGEKVTEKAIEAVVNTHKDFITAQKKFYDAKYDVDILQGALTALEHKKRALTMLVDLESRNYFARPQITGSERLREASGERRAEAATEKTRGSMPARRSTFDEDDRSERAQDR